MEAIHQRDNIANYAEIGGAFRFSEGQVGRYQFEAIVEPRNITILHDTFSRSSLYGLSDWVIEQCLYRLGDFNTEMQGRDLLLPSRRDLREFGLVGDDKLPEVAFDLDLKDHEIGLDGEADRSAAPLQVGSEQPIDQPIDLTRRRRLLLLLLLALEEFARPERPALTKRRAKSKCHLCGQIISPVRHNRLGDLECHFEGLVDKGLGQLLRIFFAVRPRKHALHCGLIDRKQDQRVRLISAAFGLRGR